MRKNKAKENDYYLYKLRPTLNTNNPSSSYAITLPAEFVEKLGFHERKGKLKVSMTEKGILITE